jgi:hypothetical protein
MTDDIYPIDTEPRVIDTEPRVTASGGGRRAVDAAVERLSNLYAEGNGREGVWGSRREHYDWILELMRDCQAALNRDAANRPGADAGNNDTVVHLGALMDEYGSLNDEGWRTMRANMQWRMRHAYKHGALDGFLYGMRYAIQNRLSQWPLDENQMQLAQAALATELARLASLDESRYVQHVRDCGLATDKGLSMFQGDNPVRIKQKHDSY